VNFYKVLGISRDAKPEEIRSAYRLLARRYHPDISGHQDPVRFREVQLAYDTLSDPESRERYDRTLETSIPVRIIPTAKSSRYAEPLIPLHPSAETFARRSPFGEQEPFEEIFRLMGQLFSRL
jgi:DnaJ-class molecular chaperone